MTRGPICYEDYSFKAKNFLVLKIRNMLEIIALKRITGRYTIGIVNKIQMNPMVAITLEGIKNFFALFLPIF